MGTQISQLEHPIDVMYLIHNALRAEGAALEELVRRFEIGDSLQLVRQDFIRWAAAFMFHAEQEDQFMSCRLSNCPPAREGEREHAELNDKLEDVVAVFGEEIGKTKVIARTQRHLYGAVVAVRIAQDDHLESEEEFVLPEIRERFDQFEQFQTVRHLLIDDEAADPQWVMDWLTPHLIPAEITSLAELEERFDRVPALVSLMKHLPIFKKPVQWG